MAETTQVNKIHTYVETELSVLGKAPNIKKKHYLALWCIWRMCFYLFIYNLVVRSSVMCSVNALIASVLHLNKFTTITLIPFCSNIRYVWILLICKCSSD